MDRDPHQAVIDRRNLLLAFSDRDSARLRHRRGGDHVHLGQCGAEHARQRGGGQRRDVQLGDLADESHVHAGHAGIDHLAREGAELFGQRHERLQLGRLLRCYRGAVQGVRDRAGEQEVGDLFGDLQRDILLRLLGRGPEVRGSDQVGCPEQHILLRGLGGEDVERRPANLPALQRGAQRRLVHQPAPGAVDDQDALFCLGQRLGRQHIAGLVGQRGVQGDQVGASQELVEFDLLHPNLDGALGRQERVVADHLHPQAVGPVGHDRADVAAADDPEGLGVELHPHEAVFLPLAGLG